MNETRPKFFYKSATLPNRKYGVKVAEKRALYESLTSDLSTISTSSIEYSSPFVIRQPSSDFSDKISPFTYTPSGYKTLSDKTTQTESIADIDKVQLWQPEMGQTL